MFKYILKRIGAAILILLGVSFVLYALLRCMPTDFVEAKILALNTSGATVTEEFKQQMYKTYGLDGSIVQGYFSWLGNICHLNFGKSFINQREVLSEVFDPGRIGTSFIVAAVSTVFEFLIAIPLGITAATHQYSVRDYVVTVLVLVGISLPSFFFGQLLKDIFANKLGWFPVGQMKTAGVPMNGIEKFGDYLVGHRVGGLGVFGHERARARASYGCRSNFRAPAFACRVCGRRRAHRLHLVCVEHDDRSEFKRDYDRLIFSSAFRRPARFPKRPLTHQYQQRCRAPH